jgi:stage II sporulation protein D
LTFPIIIYSKKDRLIKINNKNFFGMIKIVQNNNRLEIINYVPLETYLLSVLVSEMPVSFDIEAIKAQIIVARTYAARFMEKYKERREYDVDNTVSYQVYNGYQPEMKLKYVQKIKDAVTETNGLIVTYEQKPIIAYFHANSGGKTRSGRDYFGINSDFPYLVDKEDPYSVEFPGGKWEYQVTADELKQQFDMTTDLNLEQFITNGDGFVQELKVGQISYYPREIRRTLGYSKLKSERFKVDIDMDQKNVIFHGIGYGHGVGMSQWGAQGMALAGYNFIDIISFYYPNTQLSWYINKSQN